MVPRFFFNVHKEYHCVSVHIYQPTLDLLIKLPSDQNRTMWHFIWNFSGAFSSFFWVDNQSKWRTCRLVTVSSLCFGLRVSSIDFWYFFYLFILYTKNQRHSTESFIDLRYCCLLFYSTPYLILTSNKGRWMAIFVFTFCVEFYCRVI